MAEKDKAGFWAGMAGKVRDTVRRNFVFATLNFIFIFFYIQVFQRIFGAENSIVAIIMTILMGICAGRDVAAAPLRHFLSQTLVFAGMSAAACFSTAVGPWFAIPINLAVIFCILYAYTYEYSHHLYFPYILSYLFLLYISPVGVARLPMRLLSVLVSSACMILYALALGFRNIRKPAKAALGELFDEAEACAGSLRTGLAPADNADKVRGILHRLSRNADNRRKGLFEIPESALAALDTGRGMENLILFLHDAHWLQTPLDAGLWDRLTRVVESFRAFTAHRTAAIPEIPAEDFAADDYTRHLALMLNFIRDRLLATSGVKHRQKGGARIPFAVKLKNAVGYSPVRLIYALRVTLLLTAFIIPVQALNLAHGKWLLFTLASVSLPYAEDIPIKAVKRFLATLIGGGIATVCFSLIANPVGRTAIMLASGYLSFYFADYLGNYACATVGALGGAAFSLSGWAEVSLMFGIRAAYIAAGIALAVAANMLIFPYRRKRATEEIFRKYDATCRILAGMCASPTPPPPQVYYGLVVQNNLLEEKLLANAEKAGNPEVRQITRRYRKSLRLAHHKGAKQDRSAEQ